MSFPEDRFPDISYLHFVILFHAIEGYFKIFFPILCAKVS